MKKWYSYIILALVCIGFASCQDSDTVPQLQTDGRVSVHLQIALPGGDSAQRGQRHEALRMAVRMIQLRIRRH